MTLNIVDLLQGDDKRSLGDNDEAVYLVNQHPELLADLFEAFMLEDEVVQMRAIDAIEKSTRQHVEWLHPFKKIILQQSFLDQKKEIRWHLAQIIPRLSLTKAERIDVYDLLISTFMHDQSSIVRVNTMQALFELSQKDPSLSSDIESILHEALISGTAAMKARARKILAQLSVQ